MKSWTIFLALSITFPLLFSCTDENAPGFEDTPAGSIGYGYSGIDSNVYINGNKVEYRYYATCAFLKIDDTHVNFFYNIDYYEDNNMSEVDSYDLEIDNINVLGKPYDVHFNHYSTSANDIFMRNNTKYPVVSVKVEGSLYNSWAEIVSTPPLIATRDWSSPGYEGDMKITVILDSGDEYVFEITRMS